MKRVDNNTKNSTIKDNEKPIRVELDELLS
jgi:hypothetical protein